MRDDDKLLIVEDNPLIAAAIEKAGERLRRGEVSPPLSVPTAAAWPPHST